VSLIGGFVVTIIARPWSVVVVSCLYLLVGTLGLVYHFPELMARHPDSIGIEASELFAILCGVFMLQGRNWARWLALTWIAFHVIISFPVLQKTIIHALFMALIAWALFQREASHYFSPRNEHAS
jgi:hypothetical protein